jgi:hypothetical protein
MRHAPTLSRLTTHDTVHKSKSKSPANQPSATRQELLPRVQAKAKASCGQLHLRAARPLVQALSTTPTPILQL